MSRGRQPSAQSCLNPSHQPGLCLWPEPKKTSASSTPPAGKDAECLLCCPGSQAADQTSWWAGRKTEEYQFDIHPDSSFFYSAKWKCLTVMLPVIINKPLTFQNTYIYNWICRWSLCLLHFHCLLYFLTRSALITHHQLPEIQWQYVR